MHTLDFSGKNLHFLASFFGVLQRVWEKSCSSFLSLFLSLCSTQTLFCGVQTYLFSFVPGKSLSAIFRDNTAKIVRLKYAISKMFQTVPQWFQPFFEMHFTAWNRLGTKWNNLIWNLQMKIWNDWNTFCCKCRVVFLHGTVPLDLRPNCGTFPGFIVIHGTKWNTL